METISRNNHAEPTVFDQLIKPTEPFVEEQSKKLNPHHNEKFEFQDFFRLLIYYFVSGTPSISLLISHLKKKIISPDLRLHEVPRSTFNDAFERFSSDLFKAIFMGLLSTLSLKTIPEMQALGIIYCIDGSLFPTISSMLWAEYKKNSQAIRLHLCFELNRMIPTEIVVGTGKSSERNALRQMMVAGITYIADRGYSSFSIFHYILDKKAHFIFRVKDNLIIGAINESLTVKLPQSVQGLFKDITDQLIQYKNDPYDHIYRLVCFRISKEVYHILTDRKELTTFQIIVLYAYRWQIELFFRFLKCTMNCIHLISNHKRGITIQFYAMLICALLQLKLKQDSLKKEQSEKTTTNKDARNNTEQQIISDSMPSLNEQFSTCPNNKRMLPVPESNIVSLSPELTNNDGTKPDQAISHPYHFFEMIGMHFKKYWKIGIHWLSTLRQILDRPFDIRAIQLLAMD